MFYGYAFLAAFLQILVRYTYSYVHMVTRTPINDNVTFAVATFTAIWVVSCGEGLLLYYTETGDLVPVVYQAILGFCLEIFLKCDGFQRVVSLLVRTQRRIPRAGRGRFRRFSYVSNSIEHHSVRRIWEWCSFGGE